MGTLLDRITKLEKDNAMLKAKIIDLTNKIENTRIKPETRTALLNLSKRTPISSSGTGLGKLPLRQGGIIWNDADAQNVGFGIMPPTPTKGYNKHFHSKYAGGALDINTLELVEYDLTGYNPHCQGNWKVQPDIEKDDKGEEKISSIADNCVWDDVNKKWRFLAVYAEDE